jgi:hypothetical protein
MCALVSKARNLVVVITLKSSGKSFAARIVDFDDDFIEVLVRLKEDGDYVQERENFTNGDGVMQDRILVAIDDISTIA